MPTRTLNALAILAIASAPLFAQNFSFANFSSTNGLTLNGSAAQSGSVLRLTDGGQGEAASAWFNSEEWIGSGFTTTFQFQITGNEYADGIAFVIQNSSLTALGGSGGGIGYDGISDSLAVEFDIYQNLYDPNNNHVAVQSCGTSPNTANHNSCELGINPALPIILADGNPHTAMISYWPGTLKLSLDGTLVLTVPVDLAGKLKSGLAWVGFTAGTGTGTSIQDILSWSFSSPANLLEVGYAGNLGAGQSIVNLTNAGSVNGYEPAGNICANVYVFAEDQQLIACCTCQLTPNHLQTLSAQNDLISNTLTPGVPLGITTVLVASEGNSGNCDAANPGPVVPGLRAWGTRLHAAPGGGYAVTETEFSKATLSESEFDKLTDLCGFIEANGSGYGICNSCRVGSAGAKKQ